MFKFILTIVAVVAKSNKGNVSANLRKGSSTAGKIMAKWRWK